MSDNKVTGVITAVNEPETISGGKFKKMTFVVSNKEGYEGADKNYAFEIFEKAEGERITNFKKFNKVGQKVDVSFDIRCNDNNGRCFDLAQHIALVHIANGTGTANITAYI